MYQLGSGRLTHKKSRHVDMIHCEYLSLDPLRLNILFEYHSIFKASHYRIINRAFQVEL